MCGFALEAPEWAGLASVPNWASSVCRPGADLRSTQSCFGTCDSWIPGIVGYPSQGSHWEKKQKAAQDSFIQRWTFCGIWWPSCWASSEDQTWIPKKTGANSFSLQIFFLLQTPSRQIQISRIWTKKENHQVQTICILLFLREKKKGNINILIYLKFSFSFSFSNHWHFMAILAIYGILTWTFIPDPLCLQKCCDLIA